MEYIVDFASDTKKEIHPKIAQLIANLETLDISDDATEEIWDAISSLAYQIQVIFNYLRYFLGDQNPNESGRMIANLQPILKIAGLTLADTKEVYALDTGKLDRIEYQIIAKQLSKEERDKLPDSDFVVPSNRSYPITDAQSVKDAVSSFGRGAADKMSYDTFVKKLISICRRKGLLDALPDTIKEKYLNKK